MEISTYSEAIKLLKTKRTKVAIQSLADGPYIYAEKADFIAAIKLRNIHQPGPSDYDGNRESYFWESPVLHVPYGIF